MSILPNKLTQQFKNWQESTHERGFTLIELLVAISIVAVLSAVGMVAYTTAQRSARDSKRKQDLKAIQTALELYYQQNGYYPQRDWAHSRTTSWIPQLTNEYINEQPQDPLQQRGNNCNVWETGCMTYAYYGSDWCAIGRLGYSYLLVARLENRNDAQAGKNIRFKPCNNEWPGGSGRFPDLYTLTNP